MFIIINIIIIVIIIICYVGGLGAAHGVAPPKGGDIRAGRQGDPPGGQPIARVAREARVRAEGPQEEVFRLGAPVPPRLRRRSVAALQPQRPTRLSGEAIPRCAIQSDLHRLAPQHVVQGETPQLVHTLLATVDHPHTARAQCDPAGAANA